MKHYFFSTLFAFLSTIASAVMAGFLRHVFNVYHIHPIAMVFIRSLSMIIILSPMLIVYRKTFFNTFLRKVVWVRSAISVAGMSIWGIILANAVMHNIVTITFLTPFAAALFAWIFLKEKMTYMSIIAMLVCFFGVCLSIESDLVHPDIYHILAFVCIVLWAAGNVISKKIATSRSPYMTLYQYTCVSLILVAPFAFPYLHIPPRDSWGTLAVIITLHILSNILAIKALKTNTVAFINTIDFFKLIVLMVIDSTFFMLPIKINEIYGGLVIFSGIIMVLIAEYYKQSKSRIDV